MSKQRIENDGKRVHNETVRQQTAQQTKKRKRIPVDGRDRNILTIEGKEPGFHYCIVNDSRRNLQEYQEAGYEFVTHPVTIGDEKVTASRDKDGKVSKIVGTDQQGKPIRAYLMRIKQEWYNEDMEAFNKNVDASEADMKRQLNSEEDGRYGGVTIK